MKKYLFLFLIALVNNISAQNNHNINSDYSMEYQITDYDANPYEHHPESIYQKAGRFYALKFPYHAIECFDTIIKDKNDGVAMMYRGLCYLLVGNYGKASCDFGDAMNAGGLSYSQTIDVETLKEFCYKKMIKKNEEEERAWSNIVNLGVSIAINAMSGNNSNVPKRALTSSEQRTSSSSGSEQNEDQYSSPSKQSTTSVCRKCHGSGRYDCCSKVATIGNTTYHDCAVCGKNHAIGIHTCKCPDCDKGIVRN